MKFNKFNYFLLVFLWCVGRGLFAVEAASIVSIKIVGNKKIERAAILNKLKSKVGATLSKELVTDDIRTLFGMGYFEEIEASEDREGDGIVLTFDVKEKPTISKIEYEGLDAFEKDDLKDQIMIKEYEVLDYPKLQQTVEKLQAKYEEKGYYLADIRIETVPDEKRNDVKVVFHIDENDKIQVKTINIIGNKVISAGDLKSIMQTKEGGVFSWMTGSGAYREAAFERDIQALGYYYGTMGYVRARFGKPEVTVSADKKYIYITFFVEEGNQYNVGKVDFAGDLLYTREELNSDLKLVTGEVFNTETLRRETLKYTEKYSDLGYAFANVVPQPVIHDDTRTVDVTFEVERGERVYIGKITVSGNTRTKDKVIRRELTIHEGELFNGTKKRESRENVVRLGYFDNVEFHQSTNKTAPNVADIEIKVKERSTGQLVIGAGYASGPYGFTATAQLAQNNFLGNGQTASFNAEIMTGTQFYQSSLSFLEPYWGDTLWSVGSDIYQLRRDVYSLMTVPSFSETKTGSRVTLGHPLVDFTNLSLAYKLEWSWVPPDSILDRHLIKYDQVNGVASTVMATLTYDKRDDRLDPREGVFASLSSEYAGLGGNRYFLRSNAGFKYFHPIISDLIFRLNFSAGNISSVGGHEIPINELYIMGGMWTLRGYDFFTVGPSQRISYDVNQLSPRLNHPVPCPPTNPWCTYPTTDQVVGQQMVIGGNNQLLMQAELEFPILKDAKLRGVLFFDAGNAFDDWFRGATGWFSGGQPAILTDVGWGFRWFTPIGPLRFEFGYPMIGGSTKFIFTIGPAF